MLAQPHETMQNKDLRVLDTYSEQTIHTSIRRKFAVPFLSEIKKKTKRSPSMTGSST